jgi:hypothetical protein
VASDGDFAVRFDFKEAEVEEKKALKDGRLALRRTFFEDYYDYTLMNLGGFNNSGMFDVKKQDWSCLYLKAGAKRKAECPDQSSSEHVLLKVQKIYRSYGVPTPQYISDFIQRTRADKGVVPNRYELAQFTDSDAEGYVSFCMGLWGVGPKVLDFWVARGKDRRDRQDSDYLFIAMEKFDMSLEEFATRNPEAFLDLYLQFWELGAKPLVEKMIATGVYHLDIHRGNVVLKLDANDPLKVTDFKFIDFRYHRAIKENETPTDIMRQTWNNLFGPGFIGGLRESMGVDFGNPSRHPPPPREKIETKEEKVQIIESKRFKA